MSASLKDELERAFPDDCASGKLVVTTLPVDSSGAKPKVYKIDFNGTSYFSWAVNQETQKLTIDVKPNDNWKSPLNFDTHHKYFGPGPKEDRIAELKAAIKANLS